MEKQGKAIAYRKSSDPFFNTSRSFADRCNVPNLISVYGKCNTWHIVAASKTDRASAQVLQEEHMKKPHQQPPVGHPFVQGPIFSLTDSTLLAILAHRGQYL
ncbi:hypothetical protein GX408_08085 [bacterium]|nr:hypothetical protein [bacterium]